MRNKRAYIILAALVLIAVMIWNAVSEPGINDLPGNFKEVAFIRNEQNTGPVIRIYAVTVEGEHWEEMKQYGNYMPHTKYGTTRIYYFQAGKQYPDTLSLGDKNIPEQLESNCIAMYEKDGMSQVKLTKTPFTNAGSMGKKAGY